jgi:tetratricopeptide (TPR) repeat protein
MWNPVQARRSRQPRLPPPTLPEPDDAAWEHAAAEHERAVALLDAGDVEEAEALAREAHQALIAAVGAEHPDTANALDTIASALAMRGRFDEALAAWCRALEVFDLWREEEVVAPMRLGAVCRLARALTDTGDFAASRALLEGALDGAEGLAVADLCNGLGINEKLAGRYPEARAWYARAEQLHHEHRVPLPPALHHNFAGLACAVDDFVAAERHVRAAIALRREDGEASRGLGTDLAGLGDALAGQRRFADAEAAYREALALFREHAHGDDPEVAYALHNLGDTLAELERGAEAEAAYREAIARKTALFGEQHHEVAASLANLATLLAELGRRDEARQSAARASTIARSSLEPDHPVARGCEAVRARLDT